MGGGKSRCLCELALDLALDHDGIEVVVARQSHVSIVDSTRKIFFEQVLPPELVAHQLQSGGQDFVRLQNGSTVHFIGLDDPGKQFSREIGFVIVDEAHQVAEESVLLLRTRLRQRCKSCARAHVETCGHYPHGIALGFNPENPGHWLYGWFIKGATPVWYYEDSELRPEQPDGYVKDAVFSTDGLTSMGAGEFVVARATENVYLPPSYIQDNLESLPARLRDRYLLGAWVYISGRSFFDLEALGEYKQRVERPAHVCVSEGDPAAAGSRMRLRAVGGGNAPWWVWAPPVRERPDPEDEDRTLPAHRYVIAVDVSSGTANDYSAIQVIDVEEFAQVAEFEGLLDMDELAVEAFRAAVVYNGAVIVPEVTGGWGFSVANKLRDLIGRYRGPQSSKPKLYTKRVMDRLSRKWTDKLGWDTTTLTRSMMLDLLEEVVRKGELELRSERCHTEMTGFVWPEVKKGSAASGPYSAVPRAQAGMNDDLVMALAIGVAVTLERPKVLQRPVTRKREPVFAKTGY